MKYYAGLDVSLESASVCIVDERGLIVREGKVASDPEALIGWLGKLGAKIVLTGLEAGPLSQWLHAGLSQAGLTVELLETRHVRAAFRAMSVKTDRKDARGIAQLMRLGWYRPVHCKSLPAQEMRALLVARKLLQKQLHAVEMSVRGILRNFGAKVGQTTSRGFEGRVRTLVEGQPTLQAVADALLAARTVLARELYSLEKRVRSAARHDDRVQLMMTAPGVGSIVGLNYVSAIDVPQRFRSSRSVGPHFGMTPTRYQSGETDISGRISKVGDGTVRSALYEAAHIILTKPVKNAGALKRWALAIAKRAGRKKAKVALARKLAVILHRMWTDWTPFDPTKAVGAAAA
jgi:transposase